VDHCPHSLVRISYLRGVVNEFFIHTLMPAGGVASDDGTIRVWDAGTGSLILILKGHTKWVSCVAFSPDGERLASASGDTTVKLWETTSGREMLTLAGHNMWVATVAFSPDGKRLASGSGDKTVKLWDVVSGQETLTLRGHTGIVSSVAFSPDGRREPGLFPPGIVHGWIRDDEKTKTFVGED